jgi:16S rRNA (adenine1518-N6/adenine1519-N6)-dimethyltransferase
MRPRQPRAKKRFGQHFLEPAWAAKVAAAIGAAPAETIVEVGPGRGAITTRLAEMAGRVIAFEIDRQLAAALQQHAPQNLTIVQGDFLDLTPERLAQHVARSGERAAIRVAGNLPYNVASPILFKLIEIAAAGVPLVDATVMLQREVADRVLAQPGTRDYGVLTVLIGHRASAERVLQLPPGAFRPPPKVHSAVIRLRFRPAAVDVGEYARFERLVRTLFQQRRKTSANALKPLLDASRMPAADELLRTADIDPRRRPETLSLPDLARLAHTLTSIS